MSTGQRTIIVIDNDYPCTYTGWRDWHARQDRFALQHVIGARTQRDAFPFLALRPLSCSGQPIPRTSYVGCGIAKDRDAIAGNLGSG